MPLKGLRGGGSLGQVSPFWPSGGLKHAAGLFAKAAQLSRVEKSFRIVKVPGDGRCMFRALVSRLLLTARNKQGRVPWGQVRFAAAADNARTLKLTIIYRQKGLRRIEGCSWGARMRPKRLMNSGWQYMMRSVAVLIAGKNLMRLPIP